MYQSVSLPRGLKRMICRYFFIAAALTGFIKISAKPSPGLYLIVEEAFHCPQQLMMTEGSIHCLEKSPILKITEFMAVGEIYKSGGVDQIRNMDINFSPEGVRIFEALIKAFPHRKIALVIGGKIVSIIRIDGVSRVNRLVIWDRYDSSFEAIHKKIKKAIRRSQRRANRQKTNVDKL